jgi:5-methylcytosine-specific restriction endonuclease McrA
VYGNHRDRARYHGVAYEPVDRVKVFERDGYRCRLCGIKTKGEVPAPTAPTLDHIIPMAQGGDHVYLNVQCACYRCNSLKGARAANDQLLLM